MKRKLFLFSLLLLLVLAFVGCNESETGKDNGGNNAGGDNGDASASYATAYDLYAEFAKQTAYSKTYRGTITFGTGEAATFNGEERVKDGDFYLSIAFVTANGYPRETCIVYTDGVYYDTYEEEKAQAAPAQVAETKRYYERFFLLPLCENEQMLKNTVVTKTDGGYECRVLLTAADLAPLYSLDVPDAATVEGTQTYYFTAEGVLTKVETAFSACTADNENITYTATEEYTLQTPAIQAPSGSENYPMVDASELLTGGKDNSAPPADVPGGSEDVGSAENKPPENSGDNTPDDDEGGNNFKNTTLKVEVSIAQDPRGTFPSASVFTKGPDYATSDSIQKAVLQRNERAASELSLGGVEYRVSDLTYDAVAEHVRQLARGAAADAPDILCNDIYGLSRAMMNGCLMNVANPTDAEGNALTNYFDFTNSALYLDFMKGLTLDEEKLYLIAGDYDLDILRHAEVLFVHADMFNANLMAFGETFESFDAFCAYIGETGDFTWDDMILMSRAIFVDDGSIQGNADESDRRIGMALSADSLRSFFAANGLSVLQRTMDGITVSESSAPFAAFSSAYRALWNEMGVLNSFASSTDTLMFFLNGTTLFTNGMLGEMESEIVRNCYFSRGVLPIPKTDADDDFHTAISNAAELSCILANSTSFSAASAYLQLANELSADVQNEYFERGLKFKYNDLKANRAMLDIIKENIEPPFGMVFDDMMALYGEEYRSVISFIYSDARNETNTLNSNYAMYHDVYKYALIDMLDAFDGLK